MLILRIAVRNVYVCEALLQTLWYMFLLILIFLKKPPKWAFLGLFKRHEN